MTAQSGETADVVVIGGGLIGLAIAWRVAQRGMRVVLADAAPGSGASHVAAGMLAPVGEAAFGETALLELGLASWRSYPRFIAELEAATGRTTAYDTTGSLHVARDLDDIASLDREHRYRRSLGLEVQRVSSQQCRSLEPALAPAVRGGMLAAGDHQVDPRSVIAALLAACEMQRVRFVRERVTIATRAGSAVGVRTASGDIAAGVVVLAAGCWSSQIDGAPSEVVAAIRPVKGQLLRLRTRGGRALLRHVIRGIDVYLVPRADGTLVVGATAEERGFDTSVSAGAVYQLLRDARELVPDVLEMDLVETCVGLRPGTPDNAPLLGWSSIPGLVVATGHHRNGVLLTPVTADAVAALVSGAAPPVDLRAFTPQRFVRVAVPA